MILLYIYLISTICMILLSIYEWNTEEDHKGWTLGRYISSCFVPVVNTIFCISAVVYFFRWLNK